MTPEQAIFAVSEDVRVRHLWLDMLDWGISDKRLYEAIAAIETIGENAIASLAIAPPPEPT